MMHNHYSYMIIENVPAVCNGIEQRMRAHTQWKHQGSFASIHAAIEEISNKRPHLLFMDWGLSGGSAFEILHEIQNIPDYDPYIIFNTGFQSDNPDIPEKLINEYRVDKYLVKPIWESLRLHLADYLKEAVMKADQKKTKYELWLEDITGHKRKVDLTQLICICQHPTMPRCRNMFLFNTDKPLTIQIPWAQCFEMLNKATVDYFVTKHRNHLVIRSYITRFERPYVWMNGLNTFKLDVTKEKIPEFLKWLTQAD